MSMRSTIEGAFEQVARDQRCELAPLTDELGLSQSGLDSLGFALVIARLEDSVGFDPFDSVDRFPVTFGDFVKLYETRSA